MTYTDCPLYGVQSKKMLKYLLKITDIKYFKQEYVAKKIRPYVEVKESGKKRLIEPPDVDIKAIQSQIKKHFYKLEYADNVFSGIKKRSYIDNAKLHLGNNYLYKLDFTAFFPSITRERVYSFFRYKMEMSADAASILTNLTTIDIDLSTPKNIEGINVFLAEKGISCRNHLISGAPTSQVLSYLVNVDMFEELQNLSNAHNMVMSIYVDDLFFSSKEKISARVKNQIKNIIVKNGYLLSSDKEKYHTQFYPKRITGVIINSKGTLSVKNSLHKNIMIELSNLKTDSSNHIARNRLRGLVTAARQINPYCYCNIYQYAFGKLDENS